MPAYYNDNKARCCRVLEKHMKAGFIPEGHIDNRSVVDVEPADLTGFDQVHLFAGIGGFAYGLRRAGLPDDFPIWTGGDPCQGNSKAGGVWKRRHPNFAVHFIRLVAAVCPEIVLRENPSDARVDAVQSWDGFRDQLEGSGYAVIPFRVRACCVGAGHKGERLFLLAEYRQADCQRLQRFYREGLPQRELRRTPGDDARERDGNAVPASPILRNRNGIPDQLDRIESVGNSVDPRIVEWIGRKIVESFPVRG